MASRNKAFEAGKAARASELAAGGSDNPYYHKDAPTARDRQSTHIMLGDLPSGATSATIQGSPASRMVTTRVYKGKQNIGVLDAESGKIDHIQTHSDYQHKGVATLAHRLTNFAVGRAGAPSPIGHGEKRTPSGDAWAKSTGDPLPERTPTFGVAYSMLENVK